MENLNNTFRFLILFLGIFLVLSCSTISKSQDAHYRLVWQDEFDGIGTPDPEKWQHEIGFIRNNELQYYTDQSSNVFLKDGFLHLVLRKEKIANKDFGTEVQKKWMRYVSEIDTAQYTSGSIDTWGKAYWQYGKFEIRAKLPQGKGVWPAIWMLGKNRTEVGWPACGEIDIMEFVGFNLDTIFGTVHTQAFNHTKGTQLGQDIFIEKPFEDFHVYAIEWTPEKIDFLLDGQVYYQFKNTHKNTDEWPFDQPFFLKLNVANGGGLGGKMGLDDSFLPQEMLVDYVRIYQKQPN